MRWGLLVAATAAAWVLAQPAHAGVSRTGVVVALDAPSLAQAVASSRALAGHAKRVRLDLGSATSTSYLRRIRIAQEALIARIREAAPGARVRWRYSVVANALALDVPAAAVPRLGRLPGVADVYPAVRYRARLDRSPGLIRAPFLWAPDLSGAGAGMKIGIIDDGIDQTHPFFDPRGYTPPPGFPKGDRRFTTAKVIVARAFAPRTPAYRYANRPFDPEQSGHGTHVAGIAAGNHGVAVGATSGTVSGVAPRAYLGNYKVLSIPTPDVGLNGNSPEIVAGVEAAVRDGMDVINLSLGEPEVEPSRDLVARALDAAADAGVVVSTAAGNDFAEFGRGSVGSPASASKAITTAAVTTGRGSPPAVIARFSASGPTPLSLQLKPDVSAPGVNVLSSVPAGSGSWTPFSGTSMAAPHVAGAAALLRQRHPGWTVAQIKSALALTGDPVYTDSSRAAQSLPTRTGGGLINLARADNPLVFASPTNASFGFVEPGASATRQVELADAGGGAGVWTVTVDALGSAPGVTVTAPASVGVPGRLVVTATVARSAQEGEATGFVVLAQNGERRRIAYWLRAARAALGRRPDSVLRRAGVYRGNTAGKPAVFGTYRYPESPESLARNLEGPEQVFAVPITGAPANFGVAVLSQSPGVRVQPRILTGDGQTRQAGYAALPLNINPYLPTFQRPEPVAGALLPAPGTYYVVFDSATRAGAGRFTFRLWRNDTTPPTVRVLPRSPGNRVLQLALRDGGAGVDPRSLSATIDGEAVAVRYSRATGRATVSLNGVAPGRHRFALRVSDYQETKNTENVPRILPNTRRFRVSVLVR